MLLLKSIKKIFCFLLRFILKMLVGGGCLESEEQQEGHHQTEQTHGFRQGESQDSVREELLLERWVSGVTDDEGTEYCSDTGTGSSDSDGGGTSTDELRGRIDITSDLGSLE